MDRQLTAAAETELVEPDVHLDRLARAVVDAALEVHKITFNVTLLKNGIRRVVHTRR